MSPHSKIRYRSLCQNARHIDDCWRPFEPSARYCHGVVQNSVFKEAFCALQRDISQGNAVAAAMHNARVFPPPTIHMVRIAEEASTLEPMLTKIAAQYEEELDQSLSVLTTLLEPTIMVILGLMVGGLVIALYLPLFTMGSII